MRMDETEFFRQGEVVATSLTTYADALLERSTNTLIKSGYVTDDKEEKRPEPPPDVLAVF